MKLLRKAAAALCLLTALTGCGLNAYDPQIHINNNPNEYSIEIVDGTVPPQTDADGEADTKAPETTTVTSTTEAVTETDAPAEESATETDAPAETEAASHTTAHTTETTDAHSHTTESTVTTEYTTELTESTTTYAVEVTIDKDGVYTTKEDVALYLYTYGELPHNFITKKEAQALGWEGGSLEPYAPGCCIGGSYFGNYEGILPEKDGREYHECDINTLGKKSRGAERLVYSNDGLIYYTGDHYKTFELLYGEE